MKLSIDFFVHVGISGELCTGDVEQWFFFSPRQEREAHGGRPNRITPSGYWKATGSPCYVFATNNKIIGLKKTMVFYEGRAPLGKKTKWKLNEYRALEEATSSGANPQVCNKKGLFVSSFNPNSNSWINYLGGITPSITGINHSPSK